jgi:hypothetical protein
LVFAASSENNTTQIQHTKDLALVNAGFIDLAAMRTRVQSSQKHPNSMLRQAVALVRPRSSESTIDASQEGEGGRMSKVESVTASAFRSPPRGPVSPSLEMMWEIRRCDAFDEGSDDEAGEGVGNLVEEG